MTTEHEDTERLLLSPLQLQDASQLYTIRAFEDVHKFLSVIHYVQPVSKLSVLQDERAVERYARSRDLDSRSHESLPKIDIHCSSSIPESDA